LEGGDETDLTREQFPVGAVAYGRDVRDRRYILSFPDTAYRYGVLKAAVGVLDQPGRGGPGTAQKHETTRWLNGLAGN